MSASTEQRRDPAAGALLSRSFADLTTPGVVVELDAEEAASLGLFAETALSEADAWDANADLPLTAGEAADGA